jgi:hypothetical protein
MNRWDKNDQDIQLELREVFEIDPYAKGIIDS